MMTMSKAMKLPVSMRWRRWIIVMLLPWIVGCSALRLTYNQGPTLAYWWLDGYADFSDAQAPAVRDALTEWFAWHGATQLADYAQALSTLGAMAVNQVTAAQVCTQIDGWQQRAERAFEGAVPLMAVQVRSLSAAQIDHLEHRQATRREERRAELLKGGPAERHRAAVERWIDRAETLYGTLDESQRRLLAAALLLSPFQPEPWLAEQRQRHAEIVRSLRQWQADGSDAATVRAGLRRLAAETLQSPRLDYREQARRQTLANCALMAQLHNSTTPGQRQHAVDKLKGWEDDLRALASAR
jgi:hypothetical protein